MILLVASMMLATADVGKVSEALGHLLGKHLHDLPLNMKALAKGMSDEAEGKASPMDEEECLKELVRLNQATQTQEAENFLRDNQETEGVHSLLDGKLQYIVVREGTGEPLAGYESPLVRFQGETEQVLSLSEAMLGLKKGLEGMREGEIRKLFIHPELADPNSPLSILEVELIRADTSSDTSDAYARENLPEIPPLR